MHQRTFARVSPVRAKIVFYACLSMAVYLVWRLYDVQVLHGPAYAREALAQRSDTIEVFARRGSILDRNGNVLVRSLPSESVYAVPRDLSDPSIHGAIGHDSWAGSVLCHVVARPPLLSLNPCFPQSAGGNHPAAVAQLFQNLDFFRKRK
jgi:hypothetical protein